MKLGYIKHDINTMTDIKIRRLVQAEGAVGYALFWHVVECIYQNEGSYPMEDVDLVAYDLGIGKDDSQRIVAKMVDIELLYEESNGILRSKRVDKDLQEISEKCESYRKRSIKRWKNNSEKGSSENTSAQDDSKDAKAIQQQCNSNTTANQMESNSNANGIRVIGSVIGSGSVKGSVRERDCSDSLHSSSLPPDDAQNAASPDGGATPQQPGLGLGDDDRQQQASSKPKPAVFLTFPRIGKPDTYDVTEDDVSAWAALFPAIDVRQALRNAFAWLNANPKNGKSNIPRFLTSWLTREQDKAGPQRPGAQPYRRVASDRTPGYDLGRTHVFDNTRPGGEVRT